MLRFGDIYPDSWEINNRFQDAALVRNRLWRIYDKGRKIWIQTRPNSDFVHTYICTDQTVQYLCANCSFNGRYSRAKLADLPSGEEGLFEYQEHFLKCRLPLNFFLENERTNNESLNVSTSSAMSIGRRNPINLHPSLNSEAFGLNSEAFSVVSSTESERSHDNASNEENDISRLQQSPVNEAKASNAESVTKSTNSSAVKKKVPKIVIKKNNSNAYRCERKVSKNTSLTPVKSRKSSDKPKPPLKYSEVVPTALIDEKFANAVEVDRRWGYFNDLKIWVEVPGKPGHVYIYKTKKTELKCKKCRVERRYSRVEVIKNTDGFHRLFEVSNHRSGCEYDVKNLQVLYGPLIEAKRGSNDSKQNDGAKIENSTKNDDFMESSGAESSDSVVAISHLLKSDDGRVHNFTKSMKVMDRKWEASDDGRFVWCQSQRNSDLWYIYGASGRKPLRCRRCVVQNRYSSAIIVTENSGLKSLWVNENHTSKCLITYQNISKYLENPTHFRWSTALQSKNQENNVNEQSEVVLLEDSSNEENETSMVETSSVIEINSSDDENQTSEFDQSATYGEIYPKQRGFRASHLLDATKIIDRKWEMSDDGRRIWCQSESNSDLWYYYTLSNGNRFRCNICHHQKRYSQIKVVIEEDETKTLWEKQEHDEKCLMNYDQLLDYMEKNRSKSRKSKIKPNENDSKKRTKSLADSFLEDSTHEVVDTSLNDEFILSDDENQNLEADQSATYGEVYSYSRATHLLDAKKIIDRKWEMSDDGRRIWCQSESNPDLWCYYIIYSNQSQFRCTACHCKKRYSQIKVVTERDGSKSLWEKQEHDEKCFMKYDQLLDFMEKNRLKFGKKLNGDDFKNSKSDEILQTNKRTLKSGISGKSTELMTYGECHKVPYNAVYLSKAVQVIGRTWKFTENERALWCQTKSNPDLWYYYGLINSKGNVFRCYICSLRGRYSQIKIMVGNDGSKVLWALENHESECARQFGQTFKGRYRISVPFGRKRTQSIGNSSPDEGKVQFETRKRRCQSVFHDDRRLESKTEVDEPVLKKRRLSATEETKSRSADDETKSKVGHGEDSVSKSLVKYGDLYQAGHQFQNALKVTGRLWESNDVYLWCQTKDNPDLWYLYKVHGKRFRCIWCETHKRFSVVRVVIEDDGSKSLWAVENHPEKCLKTYDEILEILKNNNSLPKSDASKLSADLENGIKMDKTIDSGISLSSMDLQSSSSSVATSKSKASIRSVKSEPIISIKTEVVDLPEDLWILPCSTKNLAKRYLFIVSKENPNLGSKLMFRGTFESNLIYCCPKCQDRETEVSASVSLSNGRIYVKFEETSVHKQKCYQIDLKKTLSSETRILINPKNE